MDDRRADGGDTVVIKPILFNTEMVRAILDGKKTQTRRVCKGQPQDGISSPEEMGYKPPYHTGDILWVRETWNGIKLGPRGDEKTRYWYRADEDDKNLNPDDRWRPSIHMPREAARLFLQVKDVRLERLQAMTDEDAVAEGFPGHLMPPLAWFADLWSRTLKPTELDKYGWCVNPWVWVIEFERIDKREATPWN